MDTPATLLALGLALSACATGPETPPPPADEAPAPRAPQPPTAPAPADLPEGPATTSDLVWQWSEAPDLYPLVDIVIGEVRLSQPNGGKDHKPVVLSRTGATPWSVVAATDAFVSGAAMLADDATLYVATYSRIASGCQLAAYSTSDGAQRWVVHLQGIGPIGHSKYSNRVQLTMRDGNPLVFGNEAGGRYIEARDAATGELLSNTVLPGQHFPRPLSESLYYELDNMLGRLPTYEAELGDFLKRHGLPVPATDAELRAPFDVAARDLAGLPVGGQKYRLELAVVRDGQRLLVRAKRR